MRPAPTPPRPPQPSSINDLVGQSFPVGTSEIAAALDDEVYDPSVGFVFIYDGYVCKCQGNKNELEILFYLPDPEDPVMKLSVASLNVEGTNALVESLSVVESSGPAMKWFETAFDVTVDDSYGSMWTFNQWPICAVPRQ